MLRIVFLTLAAALIGEPVAEQTPYDSDPGKSLIPLILGTKAAQKELGLDDKQTEEIQKAVNDRIEAHIRMRKDGDVQKFVEALTNYPKAVAKVKMTLTAKQKRRLLGLEIQYAEQRNSISIFENEAVVKALKLDEK